jgi:hypothetical protein
MAGNKQLNKARDQRPQDEQLNPLPGITGPGAEKTEMSRIGGQTGGLYSDPGDGTLGKVGQEARERALVDPYAGLAESGMTDGTSISPISQAVPSGDLAGTGGGVAVSGGRGSDVGTVGGGMAPDLSASVGGGMSGGTMGGSRESDLGGGLSGGMRSGMGTNVSGGIGASDDQAIEGDQQPSPRAKH